MAAKFSVTFTARDGVSVPMTDITPAQLRAGLVGGLNGQGVWVAGGWDSATCDTCGDHAVFCPDLRKALDATPEGRAWVANLRP